MMLLMGLLQGVTEWLPISSEGINTLISITLGFNPSFLIPLVVWLHLGTLMAAVIYFRRELMSMALSLFKAHRVEGLIKYRELLNFILLATIITCLLGLPLYSLVRDIPRLGGSTAMALIGLLLIATGMAQRFARSVERKDNLKLRDSVIVGVVQALSIVPGLSRSGLTIAALLMLGYSAKDSLTISFLMGIPAIALAEAYLAITGQLAPFIVASVWGLIAAFIVGYATIGLLMKAALKVRLWLFCVFLGVLSFIPLVIEYL